MNRNAVRNDNESEDQARSLEMLIDEQNSDAMHNNNSKSFFLKLYIV